jgi:hypothetical protein
MRPRVDFVKPSTNCPKLFVPAQTFIRMALVFSLVFSLVFFSVFSTVTDFHFQANFPRLQAINHTIVHLDSDSFDIPFEVIFELREEFLPRPELQLIA